VGGGTGNLATSTSAAVGGGARNRAEAEDAAVGGGFENQAVGARAAVGGGFRNVATANAATIPGGANNVASGSYSFAAGAAAGAIHPGSFVWSSDVATSSWGNNTFTARAPGGFRFYFDAIGNHCDLTSTSGWVCPMISDVNAKTDTAPVDGIDVLDRLAALPVQTWSYKAEDGSVRHMGPMAQDFHAAFRLGASDREINTVDATGVALAAIQGLYQRLREKDARIDALEARLAALEAARPQEVAHGRAP
jgi:hypothetical protein